MSGSGIDYCRGYYASHRALMNEKARAWQLRNRERYLARKRAYYYENREAFRLASKLGVCLAVARGMLKAQTRRER